MDTLKDDSIFSFIPGYLYFINLIKNIIAHTLKISSHVPKHVGFIMDGNRRYAKKNSLKIKDGHEAGFISMGKILELCYEAGVDTVTVYAFSIENFNRTKIEVDALMNLAKTRIRELTEHGELAHKYGIRIRVIGDISLLSQDLLEELLITTNLTKNNSRATLNICFPYTGRDEIYHAIRESIIEGTTTKNLVIDESVIEKNLYTGNLPPLDLLIRTSGVCRLSDFLIWQVSSRNASIELIDCLWPEFGPIRMAWIILKFIFNKSFNYRNSAMEDDENNNSIEVENKQKLLNNLSNEKSKNHSKLVNSYNGKKEKLQ